MWRSNQIVSTMLVLFALLAFGCEPAKPSKPMSDQEKIHAPKRIITLSPALTEIVFEIGAGERVVGVSDYTVHPPRAKILPSLGGVTNKSPP